MVGGHRSECNAGLRVLFTDGLYSVLSVHVPPLVL